MAIKFYTDEHIHPAIVSALRKRGMDVLTAQEANMLGVSDANHLQFAVSQGRVILTQDSDFLRLHQRKMSHNGIIYVHQKTPMGGIIEGLILIYQVVTEEEMQNHVEFLK
jgi:predicted nuclease of predicted toxin-antitoxin system